MNSAGVQDALKHLSGHLSDLDQNLAPLLTTALSETTKKLPLLERAKLYSTIVYAIESLIFSYLKLQNQDAKSHPVFKELQRVRQYFAKIKDVEEGTSTPKRENLSLNKQAAGRMIKHALAGNVKYDADVAARKAEELAIVKKQLQELEERKMRRDQLKREAEASKSDGQASPGLKVEEQSGLAEADGESIADAVARIKQEEEQIEAEAEAAIDDDIADPQTPVSVATSELTDTSKTPKKSKKKRKLEKAAMELSSSAKKKRKQDKSVVAAAAEAS